MKNKLYIFMMCGALLLGATACMDESINENQSQPGAEDMTADGYILVSAMNNVFGSVIPNNSNCLQFTDCLLGGVLGGYFSDGNAGFTGSFARNNAPNNWNKVMLEDEPIIPALYTNMSMVQTICEQTGDVAPIAACKIVQVATISRVTDTYGPIPFSQIGVDGVIQTPYDSQEKIYNRFFDILAEARQLLLQNPGAAMSPLVDNVYGGDMSKWLRFANSLQLRLALRISYANPTLARQKAEEAVDPANGGLIETNEQNATWKYYNTDKNPYYIAIIDYNDDSRPSAEIACYMNGYNDPRRSKYMRESAFTMVSGSWQTNPADGTSLQYIGLRRGWNYLSADVAKFSGVSMSSQQPALWMNASEVCFLRAEGAAVFGWNMRDEAENLYNQGIRLSFDNWGVTGAEDYINDAISKPARYYDPTSMNPWTGSMPQVTIKWDEGLSTEQKQEKIITQKWIANWLLGHEAWADYRRTGYPFLIPVAFNGASGIVDANVGPQRMAYPNEEYTNNLANVQQAVSEYLGGPDNMATKLWWACKP